MLATRLIVAILSSVALVSAAPIPALGHFVDETGGIADKHQLSGHRGFDSRAAAWQGWQVPQKHLNQYARVVQWPTNEVTSCGHYLDAFANDEPWVAVPPSYGHATCGQRITLRSDRGVAVGKIVAVVEEEPDRVDVTRALFAQLGYGVDEVPETPVNLIIG